MRNFIWKMNLPFDASCMISIWFPDFFKFETKNFRFHFFLWKVCFPSVSRVQYFRRKAETFTTLRKMPCWLVYICSLFAILYLKYKVKSADDYKSWRISWNIGNLFKIFINLDLFNKRICMPRIKFGSGIGMGIGQMGKFSLKKFWQKVCFTLFFYFIHVQIVFDQPKELCDCESEEKFQSQIIQNYVIVYDELKRIGCDCNASDLSEFETILEEMKITILDIVDAYYKCDHNDPTDTITEAIELYDLARATFRAYGRDAFNKLPSKCNSVIQNVRQLRYISAENTITSMLTCAKLTSIK